MRLTAITTAATLAVLTTAGWAETYNANGTGHGEAKSIVTPVGEDVVLIHADTMYTGFDAEDPANPMAGVKGPCFGDIMVKMGAPSGDGLCQYADPDGDMVVIKWTMKAISAEGRSSGDWAIMDGTGKWVGSSGGGTFDAGTDAAGKYTNNVTGEVTLN